MEKTVLCVYQERRRPVTFTGNTDPVKDRKSLFDAVIGSFSDVLESTSNEAVSYFLQQESAEWGGLIDISGYIEDRTTVHLFCSAGTNPVVSLLIT